MFSVNCVNMNVGGVNYRISGMLKFDKLCYQTTTAFIIWGQLVSILSHLIGTCHRYQTTVNKALL